MSSSSSAEAELAKLKADGNMVGYYNKAMLVQAEDLVQLFGKPENLKDPAVFAKGDMILASLGKALAEQQKAVTEARAKATEPLEKSRLGTSEIVADMLGSMLGHYRQLKQSHSEGDAKSMVDAYNRAVGMANDIR